MNFKPIYFVKIKTYPLRFKETGNHTKGSQLQKNETLFFKSLAMEVQFTLCHIFNESLTGKYSLHAANLSGANGPSITESVQATVMDCTVSAAGGR